VTYRVHTKEQGYAALEALGYTREDRILSILINPKEISVRRISREDGGWAIVEDRTILDPGSYTNHEHGPDADVGPLDKTSSEAAREG